MLNNFLLHKIKSGEWFYETIFGFIFCFILLINIVVLAEEPKVNAISAVVVDGDTGRILWGKNENKPMAMASTTKIMTALVALENSDVTKETTVSKMLLWHLR